LPHHEWQIAIYRVPSASLHTQVLPLEPTDAPANSTMSCKNILLWNCHIWIGSLNSPADHRDLIIRIGGFLFAQYSPSIQDDVIKRNEHSV
jgi:hypothetical protein